MDGIAKPLKKKVFAYITRANELLVFEHTQHPEAGIQVPAGTLEPGETPAEGALREAQEESNLQQLCVNVFLGEQIRDMSDYGKDEIHHRHFYHLICDDDTPEMWVHGEYFPSNRPAHDGRMTYEFRFYWVDIARPPDLIADHSYYLDRLWQLLRTNQYKSEQK